jgi:hypothetical protein
MTVVHTALIHCQCHLAIPGATDCDSGEAMLKDCGFQQSFLVWPMLSRGFGTPIRSQVDQALAQELNYTAQPGDLAFIGSYLCLFPDLLVIGDAMLGLAGNANTQSLH